MNKRDIREAIIKGTENRIMNFDPEVVDAIVEEIWKIDKSANLGFATTIELIEELLARTHVARITGEDWPDYKTVDIG